MSSLDGKIHSRSHNIGNVIDCADDMLPKNLQSRARTYTCNLASFICAATFVERRRYLRYLQMGIEGKVGE